MRVLKPLKTAADDVAAGAVQMGETMKDASIAFVLVTVLAVVALGVAVAALVRVESTR